MLLRESNKFLQDTDIVSLKKYKNNTESYQCIICKESFFNKRYLDSHNRLIHKVRNSVFSNSSLKKESLYKNEITCLQKSEDLLQMQPLHEAFKCNFCEIRFLTEDNLINHNNLIHNQLHSAEIVSVYSAENVLINQETFLGKYHNVDIHSAENIAQSLHSTYSKNISIQTKASFTEIDVTKPEHKSYSCNFCEQIFFTENELKIHNCHNHVQEKSIKSEPIFCDEISDKVSNEQPIQPLKQQNFSTEINDPVDIFKNIQVKYERPVCLKPNIVKLNESYHCNFCELSFHTEQERDMHNLHDHMQDNFIKKEITFSDETTKQDSLNVSNLVKHEEVQPLEQHNSLYKERNKSSQQDISPYLENVHVNPETPTCTAPILVNLIADTSNFHCAFCGQSFSTDHELKMHLDCNHKQEKITKVNSSFSEENHKNKAPSTRNIFLDSHNPALEKTIECGPCKMYFESKYFLKKHYREYHAEQRTYECTFCSKKFMTDSELVFHLRTHTKAKQSCTLCGKSYGQVSYLHRHLLAHSICKPYLCLLCGQKYLDKSKLKKHYQKTH